VPAPRFPELFGDFLLLSRMSASPMAEVLLAVRLGDRTGRTFVVKRPLVGERSSGRAAQSIAREGEVLSTVKAPSIVALEAAGELASLPYLAIEHVRGLPLDQLLSRAGPLPELAARAVAIDLASALAALHKAGWVHGDIAPSNVLIDDAGEARLIDFGLAVKTGQKRAEIAGKPGYIAPEAVRAVEASPAEDIYALGVVAAECLLARRLFHETSLAEAGARGDAPPEAAGLDAIAPGLSAALKREPAARPDAQTLAAALRSLPLDRAALAEIVEREAAMDPAASSPLDPSAAPDPSSERPRAVRAASAPPSAPAAGSPGSYAITPTAPMVVPSAREDLQRAPSAPAPNAPALPRPSGGDGWRRLAIALLILFATLAGIAVGRLSIRGGRTTSVSITGTFPRRTQVELDGRTVTRLDGPLPIEPGRHTLTISPPKGEKREFTFNARPGEQVVMIPFGRGTAVSTEPHEDHGH
jgi:serine/threonine-protein kinase